MCFGDLNSINGCGSLKPRVLKKGMMGRKWYQAEQIISKLREAEILLVKAGFLPLSSLPI